jgi:hypothetical protein
LVFFFLAIYHSPKWEIKKKKFEILFLEVSVARNKKRIKRIKIARFIHVGSSSPKPSMVFMW